MCAFVFVTHAAAAAKRDHPAEPRKAKRVHVAQTPQARLERKLDVARKQRGVIRFFESHPRLLTAPEHRKAARASVRRATRRLAVTTRDIAYLRRIIDAREARRLEALPPRAAICDAFDHYCGEALKVAWCESRLHTSARNGQYLGLFQMGSYARELYGHGATAHDQAIAAHRYFVSSGRDWSPWSCKPWRAY